MEAVLNEQGPRASTSRLTRALASFAIGLGAACSAGATELFDLRYAPGSGGGDMSVPLEPGVYFQVPVYAHRGKYTADTLSSTQGASELFTGSLASLASAFPAATATTPVNIRITARTKALLPRWTFMSTQRLLGATLGVTAMLPLVEKRLDATAQVGSTTIANVDAATLSSLTSGAVSVEALAAGANAAVDAAAHSLANDASSKSFGVGDLEVAPLLRWSEDGRQVLFVPTLVLPTGKYDKSRIANPGAGNFYTFRPTLQFGHIGDGWDLGTRAAFSINSKNEDTGYRSGNYLNVDLSLMRSFSDELRAGLTGYALVQTTRDRYDADATSARTLTAGRKGRVFGLGPGITWIKGGNEMMLDARLVKEFGAQDRPEGAALWLTVAVPLN